MSVEPPTPKLYDHALAMYRELERQAEPLAKGATLRFEGSKVQAFRAIGISQSYYSPIFDALTELGCIEQVQRGASHLPSVILLHHPPDSDEFAEIYHVALTKPKPLDTLRQEMEDLRRRLPEIDVKSFVISLDARLTDIEGRLARLEQGR
jgi:hypothetical protein